MSVIEANEPRAIRCMQCEGIGEAMRPRSRRLDALDLELDPVALFELVDTPIESQQKLKAVIGVSLGHFISRYDIIALSRTVKVDRSPCRLLGGGPDDPLIAYHVPDSQRVGRASRTASQGTRVEPAKSS